jgi:hypothetical protein
VHPKPGILPRCDVHPDTPIVIYDLTAIPWSLETEEPAELGGICPVEGCRRYFSSKLGYHTRGKRSLSVPSVSATKNCWCSWWFNRAMRGVSVFLPGGKARKETRPWREPNGE